MTELLRLKGEPRIHMVTQEELPPCLRGLSRTFDITECDLTGVYFLIADDEVVYVGRAVNVVARLASHRTGPGKDFDRAIYLPTTREDLDMVEGSFIALLNPRYNGKHGAGRGEHHTPEIARRMMGQQPRIRETRSAPRVEGASDAADSGSTAEAFVGPPPLAGPEKLLRPAEAAELLGCSKVTLARWRTTGEGPPYYKLSRNIVRYSRAEITEWSLARSRRATAVALRVAR